MNSIATRVEDELSCLSSPFLKSQINNTISLERKLEGSNLEINMPVRFSIRSRGLKIYFMDGYDLEFPFLRVGFIAFRHNKLVSYGRFEYNLCTSNVRYFFIKHKKKYTFSEDTKREFREHMKHPFINIDNFTIDLHELCNYGFDTPGLWIQIEGHRNITVGAKIYNKKLQIQVCTTRHNYYTLQYDRLIECVGVYYSVPCYDGPLSAHRSFSTPYGTNKTFQYPSHRNWLYNQRDRFLNR